MALIFGFVYTYNYSLGRRADVVRYSQTYQCWAAGGVTRHLRTSCVDLQLPTKSESELLGHLLQSRIRN